MSQEQQDQIDPHLATAAQIPLSTFTLPTFPPEASALQSLTLTADINPTTYTTLLSQPLAPVPPLPPSLSALTLELFSLGYPAGFLAQLGARLPNLKSLVLYSQLLGGLTPESQADALAFLEGVVAGGKLRGLHWLDVFSQRGFVKAVGMILRAEEKEREERERKEAGGDGDRRSRGGLLFLEVNYTTQLNDDGFLDRLLPDELPALLAKGLVTAAFNVAPPVRTDDDQDPTNLDAEGEVVKAKAKGVRVFERKFAKDLLDALIRDDKMRPRDLKMLNSTLYTLSWKDVEELLGVHKGLAVLNVTVAWGKEDEAEGKWKESLLEVLKKGKDLEQLEVVLSPQEDADQSAAEDKCFVGKEDLTELSKTLTKLVAFKMNILRNDSLPTAEWEKTEAGEWKKT